MIWRQTVVRSGCNWGTIPEHLPGPLQGMCAASTVDDLCCEILVLWQKSLGSRPWPLLDVFKVWLGICAEILFNWSGWWERLPNIPCSIHTWCCKPWVHLLLPHSLIPEEPIHCKINEDGVLHCSWLFQQCLQMGSGNPHFHTSFQKDYK